MARGSSCWPEVDEGQDDEGVLQVMGVGGGLAEALGEHGEDAGGAFFFLGFAAAVARDGHGGEGLRGEKDGVKLHGAHDGPEAFADVGGGGEAGGGLFFEAAEDDALKLDGEVGRDLQERRWIGELDGADRLEIWRVRPVKRVPAS